MADEWYYRVEGREQGPVSFESITGFVQSGAIGREDEIRNGGTSAWMAADSVVGLFPEPQELSDLGDLQFTFEESSPAARTEPAQVQTAALSPVPTEIGDLSELDMEIVSSDPVTRSDESARIPTEPSAPPSSSQRAKPADDEDSWYYQSLGQELGPMPFEEICLLAETGTLSSDDLVRKGSQSEWTPASSQSILSLLLKTAAMTATEASSVPAVKPAQSDEPPARRKTIKTKSKSAPAKQKDELVEPSVVPDVVDDDEPLDDEPLDDEPLDDDPSDLIDKDTDSAIPQTAETPRWFCLVDGIEHGPVEFSNLKAMAERDRLKPGDQVRMGDAGDWVAAASVTGLFAPAGPSTTAAASSSAVAIPGSWKTPVAGGPVAPPKPIKAAKLPKRKRIKDPGESLFSKLGEHKPVLFGLLGIVAVLGLVGLFVALDLGGSGDSDYLALEEIWKEHKALQKREAKNKDWEPLIARAESLRESILPNLEKTADSKDHRFEQELLIVV
ncbi:MAG: DUF4339 domain-containing protein, partial [Planctomycetes bacterium]|nr:DUF4339 domain-containing protein [Planctomycetota bacterium]